MTPQKVRFSHTKNKMDYVGLGVGIIAGGIIGLSFGIGATTLWFKLKPNEFEEVIHQLRREKNKRYAREALDEKQDETNNLGVGLEDYIDLDAIIQDDGRNI